ncbi:MAG: OsmC family protein [Acidobacteriota bacterium]|nr:OsmC family protein [Acidobacteriota bacterium]
MREHRVLIDRPEAKGGSDAGPMGGELFLASIGGCFMSNLLAAAKARNLDLSGLRVEVTGELAPAPDRFVSVALAVSAAHANPAELAKVVEVAGRGCIMMNTLRGKLEIRTDILPASVSR